MLEWTSNKKVSAENQLWKAGEGIQSNMCGESQQWRRGKAYNKKFVLKVNNGIEGKISNKSKR